MNYQKPAIPLAQTLRRQLFWIGSALTVGCLILIFSLGIYSAETLSEKIMRLEAESVVQLAADTPLPRTPSLSGWRDWQNVPAQLRKQFDISDMQPGDYIETERLTDAGLPEYLYLLYIEDPQHGELYLISQHPADDIENVMNEFLSDTLLQAALFTLIIMFIIFLIIAWILRRTLEPLTLLSEWAGQLKQQPDKAVDINFPITELNQLANQLQEGVSHIRTVNQREQQFLKHASHELRTPLAVVQASLDTLQIQTENTAASRSVNRALKASNRMMQLSEALLWLARESNKTIPKSDIDAHILCAQLVNDHSYLLQGRDIEIRQHIFTPRLIIEEPLLTVVLANLIRNACQHSSNGIISLQISSHGVSLTNPAEQSHNSQEYGFGLGLQLVERICQKLGWQFEFRLDNNIASVSVFWNQQTNSPLP